MNFGLELDEQFVHLFHGTKYSDQSSVWMKHQTSQIEVKITSNK